MLDSSHYTEIYLCILKGNINGFVLRWGGHFKSSGAKESIICILLFENAKLKAVNVLFTRNG